MTMRFVLVLLAVLVTSPLSEKLDVRGQESVDVKPVKCSSLLLLKQIQKVFSSLLLSSPILLILLRALLIVVVVLLLLLFLKQIQKRGKSLESRNSQPLLEHPVPASSIPKRPREHAEELAGVEWNWVLIKLLGAECLPNRTWLGGKVGVKVVASAVSKDGDAVLDLQSVKLSEFVWPMIDNTKNPTWDCIGLVAFRKGSATHIELKMFGEGKWSSCESRLLISGRLPIPLKSDTWDAEQVVEDKGGKLRLQLQFFDQPSNAGAGASMMGMDLEEKIFDLKTGDTTGGADKASLAYAKGDGNTKAIFYIPGLADSFVHPHVLRMFLQNGFDLYTLDGRRCGRTRKYLDNARLAHHIDDFNEYFEEIDLSLEFMSKQNEYTQVVGYMHSAGALVLLNYILAKGDNHFSSFIMNAPFLDWGHDAVGFAKFALQHLPKPLKSMFKFFGNEVPIALEGKGLSIFHTRVWLQMRWDVDLKPLETLSVTMGWAAAVNEVHRKLAEKKQSGVIPTTKPTLMLSSKADTILVHDETKIRAKWVNKACEVKEFRQNGHDVTMSVTKDLNDAALRMIEDFLQDFTKHSTKSSLTAYSVVDS